VASLVIGDRLHQWRIANLKIEIPDNKLFVNNIYFKYLWPVQRAKV